MGGVAAVMRTGLTLSHAPTPHYIGVPNGLLIPRPISTPKPGLIRILSESGFQRLKCATLQVHAHIDVAQVLLPSPIVDSGL